MNVLVEQQPGSLHRIHQSGLWPAEPVAAKQRDTRAMLIVEGSEKLLKGMAGKYEKLLYLQLIFTLRAAVLSKV